MAQSEDPLDGLEERLQSHTKAFESLLALTPAQEYYGSQINDGLDPSEQWNRKKQTKEQKRAAKKAKLDPANQKSALDVMKERERKRKRELGMESEGEAEQDEEPDSTSNKRQKKEVTAMDVEAKKKAVAEKRKEKRDRKKEKTAAKKAKQEAKKAKLQDAHLAEAQAEKQQAQSGAEDESEDDDAEDEDAEPNDASELEKVDFSGLAGSDDEQDEDDEADGEEAAEASSVPTSPAVNSPAFDVATNLSEASSSSSIVLPSVDDAPVEKAAAKKPQFEVKTQQKPKQIPLPKFDAASTNTDPPSGTSSPKLQLPNIDQALLQERLRKRIEELRAKRKADGPDGKPAKSRQELLDQRRQKEEQRKAHKKELRREAKEAEQRKRDEQLRGSGSPATDIFERRDSPRPSDNNFSFSRLAFEDGTAADASLSTLNDARKKKGPQDPKTALLAAQKKQARISGLDAGKKADIEEKDMWLNAKKRAHGERVRDDTSLLKKALKRTEKKKNKSEKEWKEREEGIVKAREAKQKKRETNLQKRRDEKGQKGKKKGGSSGGAKGKKKGRPGFEGRFKA